MNNIFGLFDLTGKLIIVAGGAGQIGFSMCKALAGVGATVVIADQDEEFGRKKIAELQDESVKSKLMLHKVDVSDPESITSFYNEIDKMGLPLYGLVNSFHFKGNSRKLDTTSNFFAAFDSYPLVAWDMVHEVNLRGTFLMVQKALPLFEKNQGGVVVNVSSTYGNVSPNKSIYGDSGINSPVAYASSKAAIINLSRYMATHLVERGIRVNVLSPGGVFNNQSEEFINNYTKLTPLKRMANADDYQGAIVFLMSKASDYMTGSNLIVDGGWTCW